MAGLDRDLHPGEGRAGVRHTELISKLRITGVQDSASDAIEAGFASGELTARVAFGAIVGVAGGALGVLGALLGFGKKQPRVDD